MSAFLISDATAADYPAFVRLFPELEIVDPMPSAECFAEVIAPQSVFAREGHAIVGFGWSKPRGERFYVVNLIADPAHRRRGIGRALMQELAKRARAAGFRRWMLRVKAENTAARKLYESCGMETVLESVQIQMAWADLGKLPSPPPGTTTRILAPADDARFAHALGLTPADFSTFRTTPGRVFAGASADGVPVACAVFDPAFPSVPVLSARSPAWARAVLEALLPHALPQHAHLFVMIEADPALETALVGAGAEVTLRLLRMEGDVPDPGSRANRPRR